MILRKDRIISGFVLVAVLIAAHAALGQVKSEGTASQRIKVMDQKLETMKRSLAGAASAIKVENKDDKEKKNDKEKLDTPLGRLLGLEKDVARLQSDVTDIRNKVDRNEKYDASTIDTLEQSVSELQTSVDKALMETAAARATTETNVGKPREIKKKGKLFGIFGKGGNDEYDALIGTVSPGRDRELFIVATREIRHHNYDVGRLLYQTIITTYPDSPYLAMAKLAIGDSFFLEGSSSALIQAVGSYQDWLTFFPTHPLADRVVLKIAESEMRQVGLPDREDIKARRAEIRLKALLQQYPRSILRQAAEERLKQVQDNLGLHNLYIGNYYYSLSVDQKKGGLKGAQSRYREILDKYPNFSFMDEALFKLAVTYQIEEETDQAARYYQQIISDYPNSDYVAKAREQLAIIGAAIPEPNPARKTVMPPEKVSFIQNFKNQFFGIYPMTIDKDGVLISRDFDEKKFEMIDQIIENQGEILVNQIPQALTTVISEKQPTPPQPKQVPPSTPPDK